VAKPNFLTTKDPTEYGQEQNVALRRYFQVKTVTICTALCCIPRLVGGRKEHLNNEVFSRMRNAFIRAELPNGPTNFLIEFELGSANAFKEFFHSASEALGFYYI